MPVIAFGFHTYFFENERLVGFNKASENKIFAWSMGYFITDFFQGWYYGYNDILLIIHHIIAILALIITISKNQFGYLIVVSWALGELTNPVYCLRCIFQKNSKRTKETAVTAALFCFTFLAARGPLTSFLSQRFVIVRLTVFLKVLLSFGCFLIRVYVFVLVLSNNQFSVKNV